MSNEEVAEVDFVDFAHDDGFPEGDEWGGAGCTNGEVAALIECDLDVRQGIVHQVVEKCWIKHRCLSVSLLGEACEVGDFLRLPASAQIIESRT